MKSLISRIFIVLLIILLSTLVSCKPDKVTIIAGVELIPEFPPAPTIRTNPIVIENIIILDKTNIKSAIITGHSMTPAIGNGTKMLYIELPYKEVNVGDLILIDVGDGKLLLHQLIEKNPEYFRTRALSQPYIKDGNKWGVDKLKGVIIAVFY